MSIMKRAMSAANGNRMARIDMRIAVGPALEAFQVSQLELAAGLRVVGETIKCALTFTEEKEDPCPRPPRRRAPRLR